MYTLVFLELIASAQNGHKPLKKHPNVYLSLWDNPTNITKEQLPSVNITELCTMPGLKVGGCLMLYRPSCLLPLQNGNSQVVTFGGDRMVGL